MKKDKQDHTRKKTAPKSGAEKKEPQYKDKKKHTEELPIKVKFDI